MGDANGLKLKERLRVNDEALEKTGHLFGLEKLENLKVLYVARNDIGSYDELNKITDFHFKFLSEVKNKE